MQELYGKNNVVDPSARAVPELLWPTTKSVSRAVARLRDGAEHRLYRLICSIGYTFAGTALVRQEKVSRDFWGRSL